jgi:hypothetical protein
MWKRILLKEWSKFNRLSYIKDIWQSKNGSILWMFLCDCWNITTARNSHVISGNKSSCGCAKFDHWLTSHRLYKIWVWMMNRCNNKNNPRYHIYWNRWIYVCSERKSVWNFIKDMYPSYIEWLSIDRIDNNKWYYKDNCRRATNKEQSINRSITKIIKYKSFEWTLPDLCRDMWLNYKTIYSRTTKSNMSLEDAINYAK